MKRTFLVCWRHSRTQWSHSELWILLWPWIRLIKVKQLLLPERTSLISVMFKSSACINVQPKCLLNHLSAKAFRVAEGKAQGRLVTFNLIIPNASGFSFELAYLHLILNTFSNQSVPRKELLITVYPVGKKRTTLIHLMNNAQKLNFSVISSAWIIFTSCLPINCKNPSEKACTYFISLIPVQKKWLSTKAIFETSRCVQSWYSRGVHCPEMGSGLIDFCALCDVYSCFHSG